MLELRRILCPIDFSEASRHALDHALVLAGWYSSAITVLHVNNPAIALEPPILLAPIDTGAAAAHADPADVRERIGRWFGSARTSTLIADVVTEQDRSPAARILHHASALPADLVVMGTHGRGGFEHLLLGSVAEKVLRRATCPVLTVPPPAQATSKLPFKRLLCPIDFSEGSIAALRVACSIAQESAAHLMLLHVFDWPTEDELLVESFDEPEFRKASEERAEQRLDSLIPADAKLWSDTSTRIGYGKPYRRILEIAENSEVDLIVMGVRGRNAFDVMLFGSTTNQVVRHASCPVLTLRQ